MVQTSIFEMPGDRPGAGSGDPALRWKLSAVGNDVADATLERGSQESPMDNPITPVALVAEDDAITRLDVTLLLEDAGYMALEANDAHQAWSILSERSDVILLLTDVEMPGPMDGLALANKVHQTWPHIEIVVCSGSVVPTDGSLPEPITFLGKPVDRMTLMEKAEEVLVAKGLATAAQSQRPHAT